MKMTALKYPLQTDEDDFFRNKIIELILPGLLMPQPRNYWLGLLGEIALGLSNKIRLERPTKTPIILLII